MEFSSKVTCTLACAYASNSLAHFNQNFSDVAAFRCWAFLLALERCIRRMLCKSHCSRSLLDISTSRSLQSHCFHKLIGFHVCLFVSLLNSYNGVSSGWKNTQSDTLVGCGRDSLRLVSGFSLFLLCAHFGQYLPEMLCFSWSFVEFQSA